MKKNAKYFRDAAWAQLKGNWGHAVLFTLVFFLISAASGTFGVISELISAGVISEVVYSLWLELFEYLFVAYPLSYGLSVSFLGYVRTGNDLTIGGMFDAFKANSNYGRVIGIGILVGTIGLLGFILLIVPGVIFAIAVSMSFYILKDNPELGVIDVIKRSIQMMKGHKMEYFCLGLSFIGWIILGILTLGIGFMWIYPYICTANAHFYEYVKEDYESRVNG
ncbi:MAG: DUF975 family protein [Bacteroidales bacterium]|nr:DUF975 family protein [Bacteroidales bacterium]